MEHIEQPNNQPKEPLYISPPDIEAAFEAEGTDYDTGFYASVRQTIRRHVMAVYKNTTLQQLSNMLGLDPVFLLRKVLPRGARKWLGKGNRVPIVTITYTPKSRQTPQDLPQGLPDD